MLRATRLVLLLAALAGCVTPADNPTPAGLATSSPATLVDPLAPGPHAFGSGDYDAGTIEVGGAGPDHADYEYEARLRGRVWWPEPAGSYPLLVLLHGQHSTCAFAGDEAFLTRFDDCSDDEGLNTAYPNHLGYAYLAEHLASHGYVVASVLGYEVNARNGREDVGMWARGELLLGTLDAFRDRASGVPPEALARADTARIGLMGHSRGGEGVVTAVHVNLARPEAWRHPIGAIVALAPTDFNERGVPDVALLSLLPSCDGDVSTLHGLRTFDHSRHLDANTTKVQVVVRGTNHNYYNTAWYDETGLPVRTGDDSFFYPLTPTSVCGRERNLGGWRWTPEETHRESIVHVAGFLRWTVGAEAGLAPWFTGELGVPDAACPGGLAPCPDVVGVSAVLPGARRLLVVDDAVPPEIALDGFDDARVCSLESCSQQFYSSAASLDLTWSHRATLALAAEPAGDWSRYDAFSFRIAVPDWEDPRRPPFDASVEIEDADGAIAIVPIGGFTALDRSPDPSILAISAARHALQAVRLPLAQLDVDTTRIVALRLVFDGSGRALVTDFLVQAEPETARS